MPNTSISFPASPAVNQQYTYGTTTYVYTGTNWAVYVSSPSLPAFITSANIVDDTIVNADINASAAIDGSKISPVFTSASTFSSTLGVTGNLAVNTNKFTVAASSGNTLAAGTLDVTGAATLSSTLGVTGAATLSSTLGVTGNLAVNTNKFTVAASSGNTLAAGTLDVTGAATLSSTLGVTGNLAVNTNKFTVNASSGNTLTAGTFTVGTATMGVPSGNAPIFGARAWVNFNGTPATVSIRGSGNVSSITDNGTGDYTINFTTAMPDINYAASIAQSFESNVGHGVGYFGAPNTSASANYLASSCRISFYFPSNSANTVDKSIATLAFFR